MKNNTKVKLKLESEDRCWGIFGMLQDKNFGQDSMLMWGRKEKICTLNCRLTLSLSCSKVAALSIAWYFASRALSFSLRIFWYVFWRAWGKKTHVWKCNVIIYEFERLNYLQRQPTNKSELKISFKPAAQHAISCSPHPAWPLSSALRWSHCSCWPWRSRSLSWDAHTRRHTPIPPIPWIWSWHRWHEDHVGTNSATVGPLVLPPLVSHRLLHAPRRTHPQSPHLGLPERMLYPWQPWTGGWQWDNYLIEHSHTFKMAIDTANTISLT